MTPGAQAVEVLTPLAAGGAREVFLVKFITAFMAGFMAGFMAAFMALPFIAFIATAMANPKTTSNQILLRMNVALTHRDTVHTNNKNNPPTL